ncbi:hypothetical protein PR202_gb10027 [Eleusine coracana subsp. coracana]|uniref:Fungal lipase-type domain-containing protein n=1 Tax=Eleusine coracana subsp. coracana TaxID=191504 RepID=A0AAV5EJM7_ELECO|nr:hypothetical protein PR202_gb10027 [Eleusine coracana subsp. coracana]
MATATMATAAGAAALLYYTLNRRLQTEESLNEGGECSSGRDAASRGVPDSPSRSRVSRRDVRAPATWLETISTLSETLRFTYSETLGKWPIGDLAFGISFLLKRQGNLSVASIYAGDESVELKGNEVIADLKGTHSIRDTLTAATGAVVPFHHTIVQEGGVSDLVLGYAHFGMVAAARWIAKLAAPCLAEVLHTHPDFKIKVVGHSLGGGTAALLTYILREQQEFASTTCMAFAPDKSYTVLMIGSVFQFTS